LFFTKITGKIDAGNMNNLNQGGWLMNKIKKLRHEKGVNQVDLAKHLGLKQQTISSYENGNSKPDIETLEKMAKFFDVSIDYLVGRSDVRDPAEKIAKAVADEPDLMLFWEEMRKRRELKLLFKQIRDLPPEHIKRIIRIIKAIEDEDNNTI
jgi:transcriptional regulator with XRE-family HTH domain